MGGMPLRCDRGHVLSHYELSPCGLHKAHKVYTCSLRVGSRRCGYTIVFPPFTPTCNDESDDH